MVHAYTPFIPILLPLYCTLMYPPPTHSTSTFLSVSSIMNAPWCSPAHLSGHLRDVGNCVSVLESACVFSLTSTAQAHTFTPTSTHTCKLVHGVFLAPVRQLYVLLYCLRTKVKTGKEGNKRRLSLGIAGVKKQYKAAIKYLLLFCNHVFSRGFIYR